MLTNIEREFLRAISSDGVFIDYNQLINEAAGKMFGLPSSKVKPRMAQNFVFNLYSKLMEKGLIPLTEPNPILHILNNIANFKLAKNDNRLMYFIIGEMRNIKLPEEKSISKSKQSKKDIIFI